MRVRTFIPIVVVALGSSVAATTLTTRSADATSPWARARLANANGDRVGSVSFADSPGGETTIVSVAIRSGSGVAGSRFHGLHIHANDAAANGTGCVADPTMASTTWFVSADGHYKHDVAELHGNHAGDLSSPFVNADGSARLRFVVDKLTPEEVAGRAVVLHAGPDNFGNVPVGVAADQYTANSPDAVTKTQGTGNAGDRIACGVISAS